MRFRVVVAETDLLVAADRDMTAEATELVRRVRADLERYIAEHPRFGESFAPVPVEDSAPDIVRGMALAARAAGVGPMAAVAGAVAEHVARGLESLGACEVIAENGGDVYLIGREPRVVALWAGEGGASQVGLELAGGSLPLAVATSSGRIGPSVSLGEADAVAVIARDGALADAAASAIANRIHSAGDLAAAIDFGRAIPGVLGVVATIDGAVAAAGEVRLVPLAADVQ